MIDYELYTPYYVPVIVNGGDPKFPKYYRNEQQVNYTYICTSNVLYYSSIQKK